jgi:repressor of nif and glnA expression
MSKHKSLQERLTEDHRLVILRVLAEMPASRSNSSVLANSLHAWGHAVTRDYVKTQLRWLEEQGLLTVEDMEGALVVTLAERGHDVATGVARVDGVARPRG